MKVVRCTTKFLEDAAKILVTAYFGSLKEANKYLLEKIKSGECYVATQGNEVLGFFCYEKDYSHHANFLSDIVVAQKYRRKGVAKQLILKFIEVSRKETPHKQKYVLSSTDVTNIASIKMHLKIGFEKLGKIKRIHYGKDEIFFGYALR